MPIAKNYKTGSPQAIMGDNEVVCPTCGRGLVSENAMKTHHSVAHGVSIAGVGVECAYCGESTRVSRSQFKRNENNFCDIECRGKWQSENRTGEDHPNWSRITIECKYCSGEYERAPSKNITFCSDECRTKWRRSQTGEDNPNAGEWIHRDCYRCGESIRVPIWRSEKSERMFCSKDCRSEWMSDAYRGENNHNWKGGGPQHLNYGPDWFNIRESVILSQNGFCRVCGVHRSELDRDLHVHHITPVREFKDESGDVDWSTANEKDNLTALCGSCHREWEGSPVIPMGEDR